VTGGRRIPVTGARRTPHDGRPPDPETGGLPPITLAVVTAATGAAGAAGTAPRIEPMTVEHAGPVLAIYQAGLDTGQASFETTAPGWADFDAARLAAHRYVAREPATGEVLGWVAVSAVSDRRVYAGVVEHSVYVRPGMQGRGVGRALLRALIASTEAAGIWTIESGIFPENTASLRLHRGEGFRVVGTRQRLGCHHGRWRDVLLLERRTALVPAGLPGC
jgi:L-amino acid N-acyltransferase YncA